MCEDDHAMFRRVHTTNHCRDSTPQKILTIASGSHSLKTHGAVAAFGVRKPREPWLSCEAGTELLKPASNDVLQMWPVSKRVNSSRAQGDDPTLIERVDVAERG
jgi:putative SOS response-associated peptidase YedK